MRLASLPPSWPALQPAHPTLLRHHKPVIPSQPLSGPPLSPRSSTPRRNPQFWLESPPPPPSRSAVPFSADDVSHVSESPDPRSSPTPAMPRSFADAVRLDFNPAKGDGLPVFKSPHGQPPPRPKLKSAITIPAWSTFQRRAYRATPGEEMGVRRIHGTARPGRFNGEWKEVKPRHWWRRSPHSPESQRPASRRQDAHSRRSLAPAASASLRLFRERTAGKCFNCLARDHRAARCRDPVRCFRCFRSGHKANSCSRREPRPRQPRQSPQKALRRQASTPPPPQNTSHRQASTPSPSLPRATRPRQPRQSPQNTSCRQASTPPLQLPLPPKPSCNTRMALLGDPATRPDEDHCFVPTPFATEAERKEWESSAVVSWAMRAPASTTAQDVEAAFREEFRLRRGEVTVTRHHPEAFLIKFEHSSHCYEAMRKGFVKRNGIELHFIKWRSLSAALGIALMFRVRLCLDGIPRHA
ncbi:proline-rich receptor-like protein kinase PERK10 [Oryza sativa Japonica Group]|jgi:hypothetical protein|uniref:Os02g0729300 protein n=2 Tax=Oryza sativa subsp. japonica TaxID=39947 RepID=Q0DXW9_ORYSJ|nr:serine/arginine repetitive matrix protein 1 [Oryza sativa Japonica Group]BAF09919.1 Os02g0729300 [Oryza sativa Japonica Group]BAS80727.1 Os02g0729300 [Oryza sativa Japonica Group]|eukprot:NP_001048005.1 Os02g0729300 [Oryza sativa Japonica Group]